MSDKFSELPPDEQQTILELRDQVAAIEEKAWIVGDVHETAIGIGFWFVPFTGKSGEPATLAPRIPTRHAVLYGAED